MPNNKHSLDQLWQEQPTQELNLENLSKKFKAMRRKQWFYMSVDVLSFLVMVGILLFNKDEMKGLMLAFISLMIVLSLAATIHLIWLRRFALQNTVSTTQAYLQGLKNQYINNIKIAKFSKITILGVLLVLIVFFTLSAIYQDWDTAKAVRKTLIASAFTFGGLYPMWLWSNKRIKKYADELEKLESFEQSIFVANEDV